MFGGDGGSSGGTSASMMVNAFAKDTSTPLKSNSTGRRSGAPSLTACSDEERGGSGPGLVWGRARSSDATAIVAHGVFLLFYCAQQRQIQPRMQRASAVGALRLHQASFYGPGWAPRPTLSPEALYQGAPREYGRGSAAKATADFSRAGVLRHASYRQTRRRRRVKHVSGERWRLGPSVHRSLTLPQQCSHTTHQQKRGNETVTPHRRRFCAAHAAGASLQHAAQRRRD